MKMSPGGEGASTTQITATDAATLQEKKLSLEKTLANLEKQIYALETSYLEDTTTVGNILRGWDGYLSNRSASAIGRKKFKESDRLFSLSSATALKNNDIEPEPELNRKEGRHDDKDRNERPHKQAKLRDSSSQGNIPKIKKGPGRPRKNPQPTFRGASDEELDV